MEAQMTTTEENKAEVDSIQAALQYRDRAKERRLKYGTPEPPSPTQSSFKSKHPRDYEVEQSSSAAVVNPQTESKFYEYKSFIIQK